MQFPVAVAVLPVLLGLAHCQDFPKFAETYAPYLRFHYQQGTDEYCFPHNASEYYHARKEGTTARLCNLDYGSIKNAQIPTYWHAKICNFHMHIAYWSFFGYNTKCNAFSGARDAFWESAVVQVMFWDVNPHLHSVRYSQKSGWYTRIPVNYETNNKTHPVVYVGKASHGFYHDSGGSNTCCYFEDTRNPGTPDQHMETWLNLVELRNDTEEWMMDPDTAVWNGLEVPTLRPDFDLCKLDGCAGASTPLCSTCGCWKSDIGGEPIPISPTTGGGQGGRSPLGGIFWKMALMIFFLSLV